MLNLLAIRNPVLKYSANNKKISLSGWVADLNISYEFNELASQWKKQPSAGLASYEFQDTV